MYEDSLKTLRASAGLRSEEEIMNQLATVSVATLACMLSLNAQPRANVYIAKNLVSDLAGHAEHGDPNLVNPWGVSYAPNGPFWVSDNHSGVVTVYNGKGLSFPEDNP